MGAEQSTLPEPGAEQAPPAPLQPRGCGDAAADARLQGSPAAPPPAPPAAVGGGPAGTDQATMDLLTHVMQQLGQREGHVLLLSDLGALLPPDLRSHVKERGGLRSTLQRFGQLFSVTGNPGKECVQLDFRIRGGLAPATGLAASGTGTAASSPAARIAAGGQRDESDGDDSALQLRGLPYRATAGDVRAFLGRHAKNLQDDAGGQSITLVMNREGRPSGFANVRLSSPQAARAARDELHNRLMEVAPDDAGPRATATKANRYVEVFLFSERPSKPRSKKDKAVDMLAEQSAEPGVCGITAEQVYAECCAYMSTPGRGQLLLSMLGVALSPAARSYLKRTDQGLKQFLLKHPQVLAVEGAKGRESITYLPTMPTQCSELRYEMDGHSAMAAFLQERRTGRRSSSSRRSARTRWSAAAPAACRPTSGRPSARTRATASKTSSRSPPAGARAHIRERQHQRPPAGERLLASPTAPAPARAHGTPVRGTPGSSEAAPKWFEKTPSIWGDSPAVAPCTTGARAWQPPALLPELGGDAALHGAGMPAGGAFEGLGPFKFGLPSAPWALSQPAGFLPQYDCFHEAPPSPWTGHAAEIAQALTDHSAWLHQNPYGSYLGCHTGLTMPGAGEGAAPGAEPAEPARRVKLRGLPFDSTDQDVYCFFSKYDVVDTIACGPGAVQLLTKPNGRKSGIAMVTLGAQADARRVRDVLQGKMMGTRYIEVFVATEGEEEKLEASGKQASKAGRGGSAAAAGSRAPQPPPPPPQPQPSQRRAPEPPAPQGARPPRCCVSPPRSPGPAAAAFGTGTPEMRQRVRWSDLSSPSPFPDTGGTGGAAPPAPWEKAAAATPRGALEHLQAQLQTALAAGAGDEHLRKSLLASMEEA
ncbi:unnamed protein product, partial [Prorocentrum cordatum]